MQQQHRRYTGEQNQMKTEEYFQFFKNRHEEKVAPTLDISEKSNRTDCVRWKERKLFHNNNIVLQTSHFRFQFANNVRCGFAFDVFRSIFN